MALPFCISAVFLGLSACNKSADPDLGVESVSVTLSSLDQLSIETLRGRNYDAQIKVETFTTDTCMGEAKLKSLPDADGTYKSFMASFESDGLRQYARITVPDKPSPRDGFPFVLFLHGYVGLDKAPHYSIGCNTENPYYSQMTDAFARAGFAVLAPGYRGHSTVNNIPAEGLEYLEAFDQGAGLSTQFYAVDALNFAAGIAEVDGSEFPNQDFKFDKNRFYLVGHSQGGDAGLTYLAAIGEGRNNHLAPVHSALWSGTFLPRLTALEKMMPVALSPEAFLSGDGRWTGSAVGKNGEVNSNFIFGYPPDWIEDPNPENWTWQKDSWTEPDVKSAIVKSTTKMYEDLEVYVSGLEGISFDISENDKSALSVRHDPRIAKIFPDIGGYNFDQYLHEPLTLHVPSQDHYSQIGWNEDLCNRINSSGGVCDTVIYPHNNHSMRASKHLWFSPEGTPDGYPIMMQNLVESFSTKK